MNAGEWTMTTEVDPVTAEKLKADLRVLAVDIEQLLKATASQTGEHVAQLRAKAQESLKMALARAAALQDVALVKTRAAASATDDYVRANPWQALAIGAFVGLALGILLSRGGDSDS
jgi:ElaB/YqjD/DUF883 family membrane-anchored ribosome-binding protein